MLDSTLTMLAGKIGGGSRSSRTTTDAAADLAFAAELNQVWTNLIDNAVGAMDGEGTLTIRTYRDGDCLAVEIGDTGPGSPTISAAASSSRSSRRNRSVRAPGSDSTSRGGSSTSIGATSAWNHSRGIPNSWSAFRWPVRREITMDDLVGLEAPPR